MRFEWIIVCNLQSVQQTDLKGNVGELTKIWKMKYEFVSEKVLPVLTTYISHPSSSSYNIFFVYYARLSTSIWNHYFGKIMMRKLFFFFLFSTHIHTRSQWIFFSSFFLCLSFSLSLLFIPFHIQLKHIPFWWWLCIIYNCLFV